MESLKISESVFGLACLGLLQREMSLRHLDNGKGAQKWFAVCISCLFFYGGCPQLLAASINESSSTKWRLILHLDVMMLLVAMLSGITFLVSVVPCFGEMGLKEIAERFW